MREPILVSLEYRSKLLADQGECAKEACCPKTECVEKCCQKADSCCQKPDSCCKAECPKADSCCVKAECPALAAVKPVYIILGVIAVVLGTIGVFVPGLPTTPLVLLASWCFYRSSPRMQAWLLNSFLGRYIRDYQTQGGITTRKRIYIILLMATMVAISTIFFIKTLPIRIIVWVAGLIGCIVVGFFVPKARE